VSMLVEARKVGFNPAHLDTGAARVQQPSRHLEGPMWCVLQRRGAAGCCVEGIHSKHGNLTCAALLARSVCSCEEAPPEGGGPLLQEAAEKEAALLHAWQPFSAGWKAPWWGALAVPADVDDERAFRRQLR
jgi:hypothetical protein